MGDLLRNFGAMIPLTIIAVPYALIAWPLLTAARRRKREPDAKLTAAMDVTICLVSVLVLVLVMMPVAGSRTSTLHLTPGADMATAFGDGGSFWQVGGNLLMLSPLGMILPFRVRFLRSVGRIAVAALVLSMLVEAMQYVLHAGRVTATDDVILNALGATMGAAIARPWWLRPRLVIPVQTRRVCEAPIQLRVPRSVWEPTCFRVVEAHPLANGPARL
ncbi:VanZ like family protein [Amycolatopsis xylanica]|uniref:VanZ like family protein n=1 Tax=Amycolatopsis xylanica TaxID=589385 RepID=A0A1H2ZWJ8_9PSEU|nr:VanZ family protein [Amycolatopsis xylanica]SDX21697.1 VanZ like family protein [Amycolatopsis xylanica]